MNLNKIKEIPIVKKLGFNRIVLTGVLVLMYVVLSLIVDKFAGMPRIMSALNYAYFLGFLSLGVTFVIATGGIDFSIGPVMFCCALVSGYCLTSHGVPMLLSLIISVIVGFIFGMFNGYLVAYWKVPPFIVSMASMNIAKGVASVFTKTQSVSWPQAAKGGWFRSLVKVGKFPISLQMVTGMITPTWMLRTSLRTFTTKSYRSFIMKTQGEGLDHPVPFSELGQEVYNVKRNSLSDITGAFESP